MPELHFKGKEFVYNHHLTVPFRPLEPDPGRSVGEVDLGGNLLIHGDNLHALKALLPRHAGKVDCVFIDPPYNTGNEKWSYNDNVNSPMMREWLTHNPVNVEDGLRHDKWLCMMYPRLRLLHDLLSERGSLWMTLDDNEIHRARDILDDVFGDHNFVACCIWRKNYSPKSTAQFFSEDHDYILVYAKDKEVWRPNLLPRGEEMDARYRNPDNDHRGAWKPGDLSARNYYSHGTYPITCPSGRVIDGPPTGMYWRVSEEKFRQMVADNRIWWGEDGNNAPAIKRFLSEVKPGVVPQTFWDYPEVGHTQDAKKELLSILDFASSGEVFVTPKPTRLVERVLRLATDEDSLVLDSFAGSGTTAHAVLSLNREDGGNRRFILVECEDYADSLTAERVRRVMNGYAFTGVRKEELLRENLTLTRLRRCDDLLRKATGLESLHAHRFDRVARQVKDGVFSVVGEKDVEERAEGLDGSFTFCTLGEPLDLDRMLTGESLPSFAAIGEWAFRTATNHNFDPAGLDEESGYLGESPHYHVWLLYKPDLDHLKSPAAALTLSRAEALVAAKGRGKRHLVFAPARFAPQRMLAERGLPVEFAPLPYALFKLETA